MSVSKLRLGKRSEKDLTWWTHNQTLLDTQSSHKITTQMWFDLPLKSEAGRLGIVSSDCSCPGDHEEGRKANREFPKLSTELIRQGSWIQACTVTPDSRTPLEQGPIEGSRECECEPKITRTGGLLEEKTWHSGMSRNTVRQVFQLTNNFIFTKSCPLPICWICILLSRPKAPDLFWDPVFSSGRSQWLINECLAIQLGSLKCFLHTPAGGMF